MAIPLKYLSNFWTLLEMPLINRKVDLSLACDPNCVLPNLARVLTFTIINPKIYVPVVTLSIQDNAKL